MIIGIGFRYASRAKSVKNKAKINEDPKERRELYLKWFCKRYYIGYYKTAM